MPSHSMRAQAAKDAPKMGGPSAVGGANASPVFVRSKQVTPVSAVAADLSNKRSGINTNLQNKGWKGKRLGLITCHE